MRFAVMITTHNRCDDLRRTCDHLQALSPQPHEVLVCLDGCTDCTAAMLDEHFPEVSVLVNETRQGSVPSRDRLLRTATSDIVISLDDDSYPMQQDFLTRLHETLDRHPEAAVISFGQARDGPNGTIDLSRTLGAGRYVAAYANCGAAMRRDAYLRLPGFPAFFGHMHEETDYALQCYGAGLAVWHEPSLSVRHHVSPANRNRSHIDRLNARNELWAALMRCPWPYLPLVALFRIIRQAQHAAGQSAVELRAQPLWWAEALKGLPTCLRHRAPVRWRQYYNWMRLSRMGGSAKPAFFTPD